MKEERENVEARRVKKNDDRRERICVKRGRSNVKRVSGVKR